MTNISAMVFSVEKKRAAALPDAEVLPYWQIGELSRTVGVDAGYASAADDVGQVQPAVQVYNRTVAISTQLTQRTTDAILLGKLEKPDQGLTTVLRNDQLQGNTVLS